MRNEELWYRLAAIYFILLQKCQINGRTLFAHTYKQRIYVDCRGRRPRRPACLSLLQHSCIAWRRFIFCCSKRVSLHVSYRVITRFEIPANGVFTLFTRLHDKNGSLIFIIYNIYTLHIPIINLYYVYM